MVALSDLSVYEKLGYIGNLLFLCLAMAKMPNITEIDVSENKIVAWPKSMEALTKKATVNKEKQDPKKVRDKLCYLDLKE